MGWFDEQIRQRKQRDSEVFSDSFVNMAGAVMGSKILAALQNERNRNHTAIEQLLQFYHVPMREVPDSIKDNNELLEYLMRPSGIMRRYVTLSKGWRKDAFGAMLAIREDTGLMTALIPVGFNGYHFMNPETGTWEKVTDKNEGLFTGDVLAFYKPFPTKKLGIPDLLAYMFRTLRAADVAFVAAITAAVTLMGLLLPMLNNLIFSDIVLKGSLQVLLAVSVFFVSVTISRLLLSSAQSLLMARITTKLQTTVEAATMMRILALPASFFREYSSGELSSRAQNLSALCNSIVDVLLSTGLTSLFSLAYVSQIFHYAPTLVVPALVIILVTVLTTVIATLLRIQETRKKMKLEAEESGLSFALINGIQKIRLAGAEKRAFARWANHYTKAARIDYDPPFLVKYSSVVSTAVSLIGTVVMYVFAFQSGISKGEYYAFNCAYGMVSGAFMSLAGISLTIAQIQPVLEMVKPLLDCVPEISSDKEVLTRISGGIELNNVTFRYSDNGPAIVNDMSLKIRPGQYVAIVGKTGCGKSTLMRLLLGFETPQKGAIYVDGKDITRIDMKSLRRKIGVVTQNGQLFNGDIFSNITISAPWLTLDEAWEAAEIAGIADDIRRMPMGMHTIISEGSGGISGGQRQRLLIARAVASKPRLLMFDEATSALDNITQKKVSEALDAMKCTRIVIAHRLSTIRQCDRILVLDHGQIIEDGTYDQLIAADGFFAELVARQRVDL